MTKYLEAAKILHNSSLWKHIKDYPESDLARAFSLAIRNLIERNKEIMEKEDNAIEENKCYTWYFTFGLGSKYPRKYVKIIGSYDYARKRMFDIFGSDWAFQYSEDAWKNSKCYETYEEL